MRKKLNNSVKLQFYICVDLPELEIIRQFVLLAIISAVLVFLGVGKKKGLRSFLFVQKSISSARAPFRNLAKKTKTLITLGSGRI